MKTLNNEVKTYAIKSSAIRWTKKNIGADYKEKGTIEKGEDGFFGFVPTPVKEPTIVAKKEIVHKSTIGSPCRVVWDIAEEMEGAKRKDVLAACVEAGVAFYTARTQYQKYREALKAAGVSEDEKKIVKAA